MQFCAKCGQQMNDNDTVCPNCGYQNTPQQSIYEGTVEGDMNYNYGSQPSAVEVNTTGILIWSIINLVCLCLPLGIAGLVFTIQAKSATTQEQADRVLKNAKTCNLIGTICGVVVYIVCLIFLFGVGARLLQDISTLSMI